MKKSFLMDGFLAILLGIVLMFAFAPYNLFPFAILAPAGLLGLWLKVAPSRKKAFYLGFLFGVGLFTSGVYWIFISIHVIGNVPTALALLITAGFIAILSCFPATVGYILNHYFPANTPEKMLYAFPAIWLLMEMLRGAFFPWLFLGYSQTHWPLKGYAALIGVYGITLLLTICSGLLVNAARHYQHRHFKSCWLSLLMIAIICAFGGICSFIPWTITQGKPVSVALVQGNIPQTVKWSPEYLELSLHTYDSLTEPLWGKADIIIWPESALPIPLQNVQPLINELHQKAQDSHSVLILGIPIRRPDNKTFYNAIITLGAELQPPYTKRHLVPFGEFTPFESWLANTLQFLDIPMSEMAEGPRNQPPLTVNKLKIEPSICYEIAFPDLTRSPDKTINMLLVLTNDAWFGHSSAESQHLQMAAMRALEFAKPVLFVSNDGITAIIDQHGNVQASLPQFKAGVLQSTVQPMYGLTPWLNNGVDPFWFIFVLFFSLAILANKKALANKTSPGSGDKIRAKAKPPIH